jgi:hypothetical protein
MPTSCTADPHQTVANYGCLITTYAMALQQLGVNTTPRELNRWLSANGGYDGGPCEAYLRDDFISKFVNEKTNGRIPDLNWVSVSSLDAAKNAIRAGHAVIMHKSSSSDGHWFLAVDVANVAGAETLGINDPYHAWWPVYRGTLDHRTTLRDGGYASAAFRYYIEPKSSATPSLQFLARGAELLVTDGLGRRTGYDPSTSQVRLEIPNSFYDDATIVSPGEQASTAVERTLFLADGAQGNYALQFTGTGAVASAENASVASGFTVDVVGFDSQYNVVDAVFGGAVQPDTSGVATVTFDPGQQITVVPGVGNSISGQVTDETGSEVGKATVTLSGSVSLSTMTASDGRYLLLNLPTGAYSVAVSKAGYTSPPSVARVVPPSAAGLDFVLQSQASQLFLPLVLKDH